MRAEESPGGKSYGSNVRLPKASELIASALRRQILSGRIHDGEELPAEAELMLQFGVSRPIMREALRILESQRLVSIRRGSRGGATAHQITGEIVSRYAGWLLESRGTTLSDVFDAQLIFEPACIRQLANRRTDAQLAALRATLVEERLANTPHDDVRERVQFHNRLIEMSGNQTLILLSELISELLTSTPAIADLIRASVKVDIGVHHQRALDDHAEVVEHIARRDGDSAHALWEAHLESARTRILDLTNGDRRVVDLLG